MTEIFQHCKDAGLRVHEPAIGAPYIHAEDVERLLKYIARVMELADAAAALAKKPRVHP